MHDSLLTVFSGLSLILLLIPSPWHWRSRNSGTLLSIGWLFSGNLIIFINGIVWWDNVNDWAPVWCDITIKLGVGLAPGIAASTLCINRRLAIIATSSTPVTGHRAKRKALIIDLALGLGIPLLVMVASYVVQPQRYDLTEGIGCTQPVWPSLPAVFLLEIWPVILSLVSAVYGAIAIKAFISRRLQFNSILRESQSGMNTSRFLRLIALASADLLLTFPLAVYFLISLNQRVVPWGSWDNVHADYGVIHTYDEDILDATPVHNVTFRILPRWISPLGAIIFFAFFGIAEDVVAEYISWGKWACRMCGMSRQMDHPQQYVPTLGTTVERSGHTGDHSEAEKQSSAMVEEEGDYSKTEYLAVGVNVERHVV